MVGDVFTAAETAPVLCGESRPSPWLPWPTLLVATPAERCFLTHPALVAVTASSSSRKETERSIVSELSESANRRTGLTRQKTLMRHRLVVHERIHEEEAKVQRRLHLPEFWWTAVPILFSVWYSCAALFPLEARARAPWLLWSDGALVRVDGVPEICPRESICSQGVFQIVLISLARLSAFASYPIMMMTFMSKMHSTIHFLSDTYLGNFIPFAALHGVHRSMGLAYFLLAWLHTITHVIRYSVRLQVAEQLGSTVGVSGIFAIFAMTLVVWGMTLAKRGHWSFEQRFNFHWMFLLLLGALLFHPTRTLIITGIFG